MFRLFNKVEMCTYDMYHSKQKLYKLIAKKQSIVYLTSRHKSYYAALELPDNASLEDVKTAYYKLSFKYHPDMTKGDKELTTKFREISEAYQILGNPDKKKDYDRELNFNQRQNSSDFQKPSGAPQSAKYQGRYARTGRTSYYNYDEHYKMHYERYEKQKQKEYEHYKRWYESRKNLNKEKYQDEDGQFMKDNIKNFRRLYFWGWLAWMFLIVNFSVYGYYQKTSNGHKIYYNTDKKKHDQE